uniref:Replication protein A subunit n=1 Tax=Parastrongyloides trichosuri TaxID=131310 RepID=A0A0N5A505_PARTI
MTADNYNLTRGFFQILAEGKAGNEKPIVQIMNSRLTSDKTSVRLRLSDGIFSYAAVGIVGDGAAKFSQLGIEKLLSIIKIEDYVVTHTSKDGVERMHILINDFELLVKEASIIGTPVPHPGNPEEHRGLKIEVLSQAPLKETNHQTTVNVIKKPDTSTRTISTTNASMVDADIVPIVSISPYLMKWKICGVVTDKQELRDVNTSRGTSKVLNFNLADKEETEIRISSFGDLATTLFELVQVGSTYIVKGNNKSVKAVNKRFNTTGHEYEIMVRNDTEIVKCDGEVAIEPPACKINRVMLSDIKCKNGQLVDIIAVVDKMEDVVNVATKNGNTDRRVVYLLDNSKTLVPVTVWGERCAEFTEDILKTVIILKNVLVREFNGSYSVSFVSRSKLIPIDGIDLATELLEWYKNERDTTEIFNNAKKNSGGSLSRLIAIQSALARCLGDEESKTEYFNICGRILRVRENPVYKACPSKDCKKKVQIEGEQYHCPRCDVTTDNFKFICMINIEIGDESGSHWATLFQEKAELFFGKSSEELGLMLEADENGETFKRFISQFQNKNYFFTIKSKSSIYNEVKLLRWVVFDTKPVSSDKIAEYYNQACDKIEALLS